MIEPPKPQTDNLANELVNLLSESGLTPKQMTELLNKLVPYLVERDHKIHKHAYLLGRTSV